LNIVFCAMIVVTAITDNFVPVIETLCVKEVCPDRKQVPLIFHLYVAVIALFYFSHCVVPFVKYIIAHYSIYNNLRLVVIPSVFIIFVVYI
jgi:hypothetical protein